MPALETTDLVDKALLWEAVGISASARQTVKAVQEIDCRWNDIQQQAMTPTGEEFTTTAIVIVDREVRLGSILWRGGLEDLPGTSYTPESNLHEVKGYSYVKDLKGRETSRKLFLMRFGDALPEIVG